MRTLHPARPSSLPSLAAVLTALALAPYMVLSSPLAQQVVGQEAAPGGEQAVAPQAADAGPDGLDAISRQASQLEAELGKIKETSPEAADLLLQLIDLYHENGRLFGLIRAGQTFINGHASHPQHADAMLKLIDGLQAASRNTDTVAMCRQFLVRYPDHEAALHIQTRLAQTLDEMTDRQRTAEAYAQLWEQMPTKPEGIAAGVRAVTLFNALQNKNGYMAAAELAEAIADKLPRGEQAAQFAWQAVLNWNYASEWAKSNQAGKKLLDAKLPLDNATLRQLHYYMGENYGRIGQRANAVESWKAARAIEDSALLHARQISEMYHANAKGAEIEAEVNRYFQSYPDRVDRFLLQGYAAQAYLREEGGKEKGLALIRRILPHDAYSHNLASVLVRNTPLEPGPLKQAEQALQEALKQNSEHSAYLRSALALDLYRDRIKDLDKARATVRELLFQTPSNDGYTQQALWWLLYNPTDDASFLSDIDRYLKARLEHLHFKAYRGWLAAWIREASRNKDHKDRAAQAEQRLKQADEDPLVKLWLETEESRFQEALAAGEKLLVSDQVKRLSEESLRSLKSRLAATYLSRGNNEQRARGAELYGELAQQDSDDFELALASVIASASYSPPEVAVQAAQHLLKLEPQRHDNLGEVYYRLCQTGDRAQDVDLLKQALAWIEKAQARFGLEHRYSDSIGDILRKHGLEAESLAYWKRIIDQGLGDYYTRTCAERVLNAFDPMDHAARRAFLEKLLEARGDYHGTYSMWLAESYLQEGDLAAFQKTLEATLEVQQARPFRVWGFEEYLPGQWVSRYRSNMEASEADKRLVFTAVRQLPIGRPAAAAHLALLELPPVEPMTEMQRLLAWQSATSLLGSSSADWDGLIGYAQAAMSRKDYQAVSVLVGSMLENIPQADGTRRKAGSDMVAQSYARMGSVGLSIDESRPVAPLLKAALYLRLGDRRLALDTYQANRALFDQHRDEVPVDLILFVCDSHIAAGGDENHERAEDILRGWLVKFSEATDIDDSTKAQVQLMLAKNYFKAQRYDVARSEYLTVKNRYAETPQAIEAEFGIGECFMAQKVYDQAEAVFEALAGSRERDIVIRAEFLRGVLANRRGDRDEARDIFRRVLEMVPTVELANEALFNLAEVYGAEERYIDQLELLRTVGRLGRASKRWHTPGISLSIVVYDPDLGVSRGNSRIPVRVTTEPGGDEELVYLYTTPGGKGLFRFDLETRLGQVTKNDNVLQLSGNDRIHCDYPEEFKREFRSAPLSDAEISVASNARLELSSSKIIDTQQETFTERIEREAREQELADERRSQNRPTNQVKPGNLVYLRVIDADRDLTDEPDSITVKLAATSGDQVQVRLVETEPHSGIFEGTAQTAELPAGALASDTAIDHSPLMAIDQDPDSAWVSEPDGATPKWLSVDMKDLRYVDRVTAVSPDPTSRVPLRGDLQGSHDGRFWFRIASNPPEPPITPLRFEEERMTQRVYLGNHTGFDQWEDVVNLAANSEPIAVQAVDALQWQLPQTDENNRHHSVIWHGKFVQHRAGAVRFAVDGVKTALAINGRLELALGPGGRTVDVWLDRGTHDLTIFAATNNPQQGVRATRAREDHDASQVNLTTFRLADFDLEQPGVHPAIPREAPVVTADNGVWDFRFPSYELRHVRLVVHEYLGEAVAISHVEVTGEEGRERHIPTEADILALSNNGILEIAGGDVVEATYTDEFTQNGNSQLLTASLRATYFNAVIAPIAYDFVRQPNGAVATIRKELIRIDPGEKFVIEIVDYDLDQTGDPDKLRFQVAVNDGEPLELIAHETEPYSGIFTKGVETSAQPETGKLHVKPGDRIYCTYIDAQNTFPGHAVPRETVVYVNEPTAGRIRVVESRYVRPADGNPTARPQTILLPTAGRADDDVAKVAFEVPFTVEVYDRDAAKDSRSKVTVTLQTTDGAEVDVECVVSENFGTPTVAGDNWALEEGRFVGQVIIQLGGKNSPSLVPLSAEMPRNLIGGPVLSEEDTGGEASLLTRVLNLTGNDIVTATYRDELRPDGPAKDLGNSARLIANGTLAATDRDYDKPVSQLHVGEKLFLRVVDADLDTTDDRDFAEVVISSDRGERETIRLEETLSHSGVFTGSVTLKPSDSPTPGNLDEGDAVVETFFGDMLRLEYLDRAASTESGELALSIEVPVVVGTDGLVMAFSKTFNDENLAVETQFHIAESYFELFKSHKSLGRKEEQITDLEAGRRVLREVMEDYPNPKYIPRVAYLLGQFAQELEQWDEAVDSYRLIVRQYPDHALAADAQYKMAQCYEKSGQFDQALEAYVTLAATYPKSPLIAKVMVNISKHFYQDQNYLVAAQVSEKFLEKFEGHEYAPQMAFLVGQAYYKNEQYRESAAAFDRFVRDFPDEMTLAPEAMFWAGEALRHVNDNREAFRRYNMCHWKYPSSEPAKYARGRLALPEMIQQFEAEARALDNP